MPNYRASIVRIPLRCAANHRLQHKNIEGGYHGHSYYDDEHQWKFCTYPLATEGTWLPGDEPCHYCEDMPGITKDHIVPKSKRGSYASYNLVPACVACNGSKRDKMPSCGCDVCIYALVRWMIVMGLVESTQLVDPRHPVEVSSETFENTG